MKKFMMLIVFCLAMCSFAFAQSPLAEFDKVKQIKLLESTREDVRRIFVGYKESNARDNVSNFETKFLSFNIFYSCGNCSDKDEDWNAPEGRVTYILIFFKRSMKPEDLAVDLSSLRKEKTFSDSSDNFIYHDKSVGLKYDICKGKITSMDLFPSKENLPFLCNNKKKRKFYEIKRWSRKKIKKSKINIRYFANVTNLTLSSNEIIAGCDSNNSADNKSCADSPKLIDVLADVEASCEFETFTYNYSVTGGKIIGQGEKVVWDLWDVKAGTYIITASVDPGCGVCGTTKTETVVVKECPDCSQK